MALRFATGKSSQAFAIELIRRSLGQAADSLKLGDAQDWRANYRRVFAQLTALETAEADARMQTALLGQLHRLIVDENGKSLAEQIQLDALQQASAIRTVTVRGLAPAVTLSTIGAPTAEALILNNLAEPGVRRSLQVFDELSEGQLNPTQTMIAIGSNAELSLVPEWLSIGGAVIAVARPNRDKWMHRIAAALASGGSLTVPIRADRATEFTDPELQELPIEHLADLAGLDLESDLPAIAGWLANLVSQDSTSAYVALATIYAGGSKQILASAAQDALFAALMDRLPRGRLTLGWLATPLESISASEELLDARESGFRERGILTRLRDGLLRVTLGGPKRPLRQQVLDFSVARQGSSYLLAKRIERWRADSASALGYQTWLQVAPPAVTHSTVGHKFVRAAFRGATSFGITSFEPWMLRDLLTASLLGALKHGESVAYESAIHGGVWRSPYQPDSIWLPATVLGWRGFI